MIVTIMQPAYLPWLGYFDRIRRADLFVVLDHVAMDRSSRTKFANRNKIRTETGWMWLTVPTETKGARDVPINELQILGEDWKRQHRATIGQFYRRAPHYGEHSGRLDALYAGSYATLADAADATTEWLAAALGIETETVTSSSLRPAATKSELILELCLMTRARTYLSGPFGRDYLDLASFTREGIEVVFHDYAHPQYAQVFPPFEPYMSALDLVLNHGPDSRAILEGRTIAAPAGVSLQ